MVRRSLPLITHSGGRSAMTCRAKCGDACFQEAPNTSGNPYFGDLVATALSRRSVLRASMVLAGAGTAGVLGTAAPAAASPGNRGSSAAPGLRFTPVAPNTADTLTVPDGYAWDVVIRWGDPLFDADDEFDPFDQTPEKQLRQFGYNCDYLGFLPLRGRQQLLVSNHEYTSEEMMFDDYDPVNPTEEQVQVAWAAHGLSVVVVEPPRGRPAGLQPVVGHELNRRFHTSSPFELTGPVAGSELVRTTADPEGRTVLGTLNNCAGGLTPWGTWLTAEENFNQYFANANQVSDPVVSGRLARYGMSGGTTGRRWEEFDPRFDLAQEPNEANRFGWVVEIDPYDPTSTPKKRTALGRFKHEAAEPRITDDGRVAVYMGDDERFDYFYKFVSSGTYRPGNSAAAKAHNATLLDEGTLYVARFTGNSPAAEITGTGELPADGAFDGSGEWIPLVSGTESFVEGMSAEEVLLFTRQAGDMVGATAMDRPEDVEPSPTSGHVYVALTNNSRRGTGTNLGVDEANPRVGNKHGQVLELIEAGNDAAAETFAWSLFLVCGDPGDPGTYFGGFDPAQVSPISCPDNLTFDSFGNLWISTDGNALGTNDGLFGVAVEGPYRGQVKQFLTVPLGAETCGPWVDNRQVFVNVQHPGETDGSTFANPSSHWPDGGSAVPRPSVAVVWNERGGRIGQGS
ncbi:PhoX family protein [Ruania halotolerans]|uniref:PhoX family protein n=1 Tax=Ruania halotolerans TaxID=2897773 RepID=UPI001E5E9E87|nr:PhoX family phosphatase [Ruania halotolerans]UFU06906.1 PhoX family phosphatase [Ruania halotolerans]